MTDIPEASRRAVRCAAVLAGGKSRRMGSDKALVLCEGEPLIVRTTRLLRETFPRVVVVTSSPEVISAAGDEVECVPDLIPDCGPLSGLHAALRSAGGSCLVVACDLPFLRPDFLLYLAAELGSSDAVVPESLQGPQPLQAVYAPSCLPVFARHLAAVTGSKAPALRAVLAELEVQRVPVTTARRFDPALRFFENWNTPADVRDTSRRAQPSQPG